MNGKKKMISQWIITVLLAGIILILALPLLFGAGYTYPSADDFIIENGSLEYANMLGPVRGHLYGAYNYFTQWQGTYVSNFILFTLLPFSRFGLNGFRIVMVMIALFFVCSLYFMVNAVINFAQASEAERDKHSGQNQKLFLYAVLLFAALGLPGTWIGKEVFYWYTAALVYMIGISSLFVSLGCFLMANCREKNRGYYICSMLFGFAASGTSLEVVAFVCSWHLIALLIMILSTEFGRKKLHFWNICPFLASFCGALINAASPGGLRRNRFEMEEAGVNYGVIDAIKDTFKWQKIELSEILHDPVFIALVVIVLLICIAFKVRAAEKERPVTWIGVFLVVCGVLVSDFLCIFPVVLGYHGGGLSTDRTKYVADLEIRFSLLFAVIYIAQYILQILSAKGKLNKTFYLISTLGGVLVCIGGFLLLNNQSEDKSFGYSFELIREFSNGTVQEVFSLRKEVLDTLEAAEDGTDVYLKMPPMPPTRVTYSQGITTDPGYQVNKDVASLYNLNSVAVEYGAR